ncbi:MAG: trehalose-6-phosphate synthase [Candidatus Omnitrophica bacterium]|nr:trehalose-6-phosphate synthase [Candidatus Omnitrophota bacterium]
MRTTLKLIFSLVLVIAVVACGFSYWQSQQEESRLKNELERRAAVVAENLKESTEPYLKSGNVTDSLLKVINKISIRERVLGVAIHDAQGALIVASSDLSPKLKEFPDIVTANLQEVERLNSDFGRFLKIEKIPVHAFSAPFLVSEKDKYTLTLFNNAAYIEDRVRRIWLNSFLRALVQALLVGLTALIVVYLNVMTPIRKTTEWIKKIRLGEMPGKLNPKDQVLLGPLANEISKMAKSLEMARSAAEEEARLRQSTASLWTAERLKEFVRVKLESRLLFVVSNREPYMHLKKGKEVECIVPASGMVTAIEPVLKACGGTWIAHGSGDVDRQMVDSHDRLRVPPEEPQYTLRRVWISKEEEDGYYYGFSNEGLWPLCHIAHTRPIFREENWADYKAVNEKFAEVVCEEIKDAVEPCVLIQDYHFALLPALIKKKRPDARVAIFWHIPWPNPESFGICPWSKELLLGMLGADIIGFHTQYHCNNFMETVDRFLESRIDYERFTVNREGQTTWVKPFPISIAFTENSGPSTPVSIGEFLTDKAALLKPHGIQAEYLGVGVDRLDYTKGILERFRSVEHFLKKNPKYQGKFTFVQLGAPSRTAIPKYQEFMNEVEGEVERINSQFKIKNWKPILFLKKHHSHKDIAPFYRLADLCLVTSLHDGMNLVAKEFIAAREDQKGTLILSQFTGAARELGDALIVNPYDIVETSAAIKQALEMSAEEQARRMGHMRTVLRDWNIYRWAADVVGELARVRLDRI